MEDLRMALLKDTSPKNIKVLIKKFKKHVIYDELCDFCDMCEILHIEIADSVRKFVVEFILEFRRENLRPYDERIELDIPGREKLVSDILEENLDAFDDLLDDEKIHILLFLARIMKVMCFNDRRGVPWAELRFLMCIYVATNTDKHHVKYPLIDCMFQFLIDEELIVNNLRNLLEMLKNGSKNDKWLKSLRSTYKSARYYYELQKIYFHLEFLQPTKFDDYLKNELILIRHFQHIGESLKVIEKLGIIKKQTNSVPYIDMYSIPEMLKSFITMRNTLSHAKTEKRDVVNDRFVDILRIVFVKLDIIIFELIKEEQLSIMDTYLSKLIEITDSKKLLSEIDRIDAQEINNWDYKEIENVKIKWLTDFISYQVNCVEGLDEALNVPALKYVQDSFDFYTVNLGQFNKSILTFFRNLHDLETTKIKDKLKYLRNNKDIVQVSQFGVLTKVVLKLMTLFNTLPLNGNMFPLYETVQCLHYNRTRIVENIVNKSDDYKIDKVLEIIITSIVNIEKRQIFHEFTNNLLLKRQVYKYYKLIRDPYYIRAKWPKNDASISWNGNKITYEDPLVIILSKTKKNLPDFKSVEHFLDKIDLEYKTEIVEKAKHLEEIKLKNRLLTIKRELGENEDDHFAKEMAVLDGFEISRLLGRELPMEPNYMDYHCLLPTGRPLRNFLAHGDIYLDLFLTQADKQTILDQQLEAIINQMDEENQLIPIVSHKEDLSYLKERFNRQKSWIKMFIAPLKLSVEDRFPPGNAKAEEEIVVAMRARDIRDWGFVHYNMEKCDSNNKFVKFLIDKLSLNESFVDEESLTSVSDLQNKIYDKIIEESKSSKAKYLPIKLNIQLVGYTIRGYLIGDFINDTSIMGKRYFLTKILSINCLEMDFFQKLFRGLGAYSLEFLDLACFFKQNKIVKYIIEKQRFKDRSQIQHTLELGIVVNNLEMVEYLIDQGALVNKTQAMEVALTRANFEAIKLLLENGVELDFSLLLENTSSFWAFSNTNIFEHLVEKYPSLINYENSVLIFRACGLKSKRLVRFFVEKGANLDAISKKGRSVLASACLNFNDRKLVEYLVGKGAKIESETNPNPLMAACFNGNVEIAKYFLEKGANPSIEFKMHTSEVVEYKLNKNINNVVCLGSPLNYAIRNQSFELSEEFFRRNLKINENTVGEHIAKIEPKFFKYLISKDSNPNWVINSLRFCIISDRNIELLKEMLKFLKIKKHHLVADDIRMAFQCKATLLLLLEYPYHNINQTEWTCILINSFSDLEVEEMKIIILKGANINYKSDDANLTLLHCFFKFSFFDTTKLRFFLYSGADFTAKTKNQVTPIQIAAQKLDEQSFQQVLKIVLETRDVCIKLHKYYNLPKKYIERGA